MDTLNTVSPAETGPFLDDMYARWTLDCLVEIAHAVSIDYFSNPEFYQGDDTPAIIADLWASYGSNKHFANRDQRNVLAGAILGGSDGYPPKGAIAYNDAFHQDRDPLFKACIAAQTATSAQSRDGLNQQVLQALPNFQSYLEGFTGKAAGLAYAQIKAVTEVSFAILRSDTVSTRFIGIHSRIDDNWPLSKSDPNGDKLIAECVAKLKLTDVNMPSDFPNLRALAKAGSDALKEIVKLPPDLDLDELIRTTYSWAMFTGNYEPYTGKQ